MIVFFPKDIFSEYVQLGPSTAPTVRLHGPGLLRWTGLAKIFLTAGSSLKKVGENLINTPVDIIAKKGMIGMTRKRFILYSL